MIFKILGIPKQSLILLKTIPDVLDNNTFLYRVVQKKKVSDEIILISYKRTHNIWKTGKEVGLCGQSVHERLQKLNAINKKRIVTHCNQFTDQDILINEYAHYRDNGILYELAIRLKRTVPFICRKAKELGLTDSHHRLSKNHRNGIRERVIRRLQEVGHPKGMLGKKHTGETLKILSEKSKAMWKNKAHFLNSEEHRQNMSDRSTKMMAERLKSSAKPANQYSRVRHGSVTIGGKTFFARSSWEANIGAYLEFLKANKEILDWEHEPKTFWFEPIKRGVRSYMPDFLITANDGTQYYEEVKGWMDKRSATKLKRMKKYYPEIDLRVIDTKRYSAIKKSSSIIPQWGLLEKLS